MGGGRSQGKTKNRVIRISRGNRHRHPPQSVPLELTLEKQGDGKENYQYPLRWNRGKEQQQLGIKKALEEEEEEKKEQGNKTELWPRWQPEKMRPTTGNQKQQYDAGRALRN